MTTFFFLLFNLVLILFFRGLLISVKIISKKDYSVDTFKVSGVPIFIFYPILTFFIIGNLSVLLNFFFPIKNLRFYWLLVLIFFLLMNFREPILYKNYVFLISSFLIVPAILSSLRSNSAKTKIIKMEYGNKKSRIVCWKF